MTEPRQPEHPPADQDAHPHPHAPNGVPPEAKEEGESKGLPHSEREQTETAAKPE